MQINDFTIFRTLAAASAFTQNRAGWNLVGWAVFELVLRELPRVVIPVFLLVVLSLWLAFRNLSVAEDPSSNPRVPPALPS